MSEEVDLELWLYERKDNAKSMACCECVSCKEVVHWSWPLWWCCEDEQDSSFKEVIEKCDITVFGGDWKCVKIFEDQGFMLGEERFEVLQAGTREQVVKSGVVVKLLEKREWGLWWGRSSGSCGRKIDVVVQEVEVGGSKS